MYEYQDLQNSLELYNNKHIHYYLHNNQVSMDRCIHIY
jgi:hypothetical protein